MANVLPHIVLSHGLHSSPQATKVSFMAEVAESLGFTTEKPDFSDLDATGDVNAIHDRIARLVDACQNAGKPVVLAGSSMGSFASVFAAHKVDCRGLFLLVPPPRIEGFSDVLPEVGDVPTEVIHAWHDELIPAQHVIDWCAKQSIRLTLVDDTHRLSDHVRACGQLFGAYLTRYFLDGLSD